MSSRVERVLALLGAGAKQGGDAAQLLMGQDNATQQKQAQQQNEMENLKKMATDPNLSKLIGDFGSIHAGDTSISAGRGGAMMNNTLGREAKSVTGEYNKSVMPFHQQALKSMESVNSLLSGTSTGEEIAQAAKARIIHNGGQVPQGLIQAFGAHGSSPAEFIDFLNKSAGTTYAQMTPDQRKSLGDELMRDVDFNRDLAKSAAQRFTQQAPGLAPTMASTGALQSHLASFSDPSQAMYDDVNKKYADWQKGQSSLPGPGQHMGAGELARQNAGKVGGGIADTIGGMLGFQRKQPQPSAPASPTAQAGAAPPQGAPSMTQTGAPSAPSTIRVRRKADGLTGTINSNEFDASQYDKL